MGRPFSVRYVKLYVLYVEYIFFSVPGLECKLQKQPQTNKKKKGNVYVIYIFPPVLLNYANIQYLEFFDNSKLPAFIRVFN